MLHIPLNLIIYKMAGVIDLSFWTLFSVKFKSRRFSKTVANDFGTVSSKSISSEYSLFLSEWQRPNHTVP